jgi:hypothetical protein
MSNSGVHGLIAVDKMGGTVIFIACQGDGSIYMIDLATRQVSHRFAAGVGCETLDFF